MYKQYLEEIYRKLGYLAVWAPSVPVAVGDVGTIKDTEYRRVDSLRNLGISFQIRQDDTGADYTYSSKGAVSITFKLAGDVPSVGSHLVKADAGISIGFTKENAVVFCAAGCKSNQIDNLSSVIKDIEWRYEKGEWPEEHFVVTEVVRADRATIVVSSGRDASLDLRAKADVTLADLRLANAEAGLDVAHSSNLGFSSVAEGGLTPLFRAGGMKRRLLGGAGFRARSRRRGGGAARARSDAEEETAFSDLKPDDLIA